MKIKDSSMRHMKHGEKEEVGLATVVRVTMTYYDIRDFLWCPVSGS